MQKLSLVKLRLTLAIICIIILSIIFTACQRQDSITTTNDKKLNAESIKSVANTTDTISGSNINKNLFASVNTSSYIDDNGRLWAWGYSAKNTPNIISSGELKYIAYSMDTEEEVYNFFTLSQNGHIKSSGYNNSGLLGDGTSGIRKSIADVILPAKIEEISIGAGHALARDDKGNVWSWGSNSAYQLGDGTNTVYGKDRPNLLPVQLKSFSNIKQVAACGRASLVLSSNGDVTLFGKSNRLLDNNVSFIGAGYSHALFLKFDGTVWAWGSNEYGLGDGSKYSGGSVQIKDLSNVLSVSAGKDFSLALKSDGTVWAWGVNKSGQLGSGTTQAKNLPSQVKGLSNIVAIAAGNNHCLALAKDKSIWVWGENKNGQLGDGMYVNRTEPYNIGKLVKL